MSRISGWIWNWCHFELDFEFISWISKSFWNGPSTLHSCLQMAITSSFQLRFVHYLKHWTPNFPSFEKTYSTSKMDSRNFSKFVLKFKVYVATRFWVLNFHQLNLAWCLIFHVFLLSFLLHNGHFSSSKLMISSSCIFSWSMSLDSLISSFSLFLIFQNLKRFNLHYFFPLNIR